MALIDQRRFSDAKSRPMALVWRWLMACGLLCAGASAHAGAYEVVDLYGSKQGYYFEVVGVDQRGAVVGTAPARYAPHPGHPVKFMPDGRMIDLAARAGMLDQRGRAAAINNRGQTTGLIETALGKNPAVFIERMGTMTLLPGPSDIGLQVTGINERGDVVGRVNGQFDACFGDCAYVIHQGTWTILPSLPRGQFSQPNAINKAGLIVGESFQGTNHQRPIKAVQWQDGKVRIIPGMEHLFASAWGVNDRGDIVGSYDFSEGPKQHAFMWREGALIDLHGSDDGESRAWAVNESGQVIGSRFLGDRRGSFVTVDGTMQWLDDLLLPGPDGPWTLSEVRGINDAGQIAGMAQNAKGLVRAVLLNPVAQ